MPHSRTSTRRACTPRDRNAWPLVALVALACGSCKKDAHPAPRTWPAGTVLVLNHTPITVDEVDAISSIVARAEPAGALNYLRRVALTNVLFQRVVGIQIAGEQRAAALELARACKRDLDLGQDVDGTRIGVARFEREGGVKEIGFEAWNVALDAEEGRWSEPFETIGAFEIARVNERTRNSTPQSTVMKVSVLVIPYVTGDVNARIEAALDRARLEFIDPTWNDVVPEYWKHRMRGGSP